jgi:hypothetical protein
MATLKLFGSLQAPSPPEEEDVAGMILLLPPCDTAIPMGVVSDSGMMIPSSSTYLFILYADEYVEVKKKR